MDSPGRPDPLGRLIEVAFTLLLAGLPAFLLWSDFGLAVGAAYFVIAMCAVSIHYDTRAIRKGRGL